MSMKDRALSVLESASDASSQAEFQTPETPAESPAATLAADRGVGLETILLVEDEDSVRAMVGLLLRARGYSVLEASDGLEAVQVCERHRGKIDLLITDMMMPRMNGHDAAVRIKATRPDVRVLFLSGYTDDSRIRSEVERMGAAFLQKPVGYAVLQDTVRSLLALPPRSSSGRAPSDAVEPAILILT